MSKTFEQRSALKATRGTSRLTPLDSDYVGLRGSHPTDHAPLGWTHTERRPLQLRKSSAAGTSKAQGPRTVGAPLPGGVRAQMEESFQSDFSSVRVHEGSEASALGAVAYTQGSDIHFAPGKFQPSTQSGQELIGHELAHVVQQSAGRVAVPQGKDAPINADPGLEAEADRAGAAAARGERAAVHGNASGLQLKRDPRGRGRKSKAELDEEAQGRDSGQQDEDGQQEKVRAPAEDPDFIPSTASSAAADVSGDSDSSKDNDKNQDQGHDSEQGEDDDEQQQRKPGRRRR